MKMLLGEKIRELRRRDGRTQEDVAVATLRDESSGIAVGVWQRIP